MKFPIDNKHLRLSAVSLVPLNLGLMAGWMSPMSLVLTGKYSPVGVLTKGDISFLAALPNYVALLFAPAFCLVLNRCGRRIGLHFLSAFSILSAYLIKSASSKIVLYMGCLTSGFITLGGTFASIYVTEISHVSIRGILMCYCNFQITVGILLSYVLGNVLTYKTYNSCILALPVIYLGMSRFIVESPFFLFDQNKKDMAIRCLLWYRGNNRELVEKEIEAMESARANRLSESTTNSLVGSAGVRRAAIISVILNLSQGLSGFPIILTYDEIIYQEVGSPISIEYSSIFLVSALIGTLTVEVLGRKPLLYLSYFIGTVSMSTLTIYLIMKMEERADCTWIPFICINVFVFGYGLGLHSIPGLITTEIVASSMLPTISAIITMILIIMCTIIVQSFTLLDESIGLYGVFIVPTMVNFMGGIFVWYVVPETKGKTYGQILNELGR